MTHAQLEKIQEIGNRFWLYVVEPADEPDYGIWRIQNPADRVTSLMDDDGWKWMAKGDEVPAAILTEQAGKDA